MHGEYLLVLGAILFFPLVLTFVMRLRLFARYRVLIKVMAIVCATFWIWDVLATARGHWSFNPAYTMGWNVLGMPAEEWLFFPVLVFVAIFTYEAVRKVWKRI